MFAQDQVHVKPFLPYISSLSEEGTMMPEEPQIWHVKPYTLHIYIRDPTLIAWIQSLPTRHRSRAIEAALRRGLDRSPFEWDHLHIDELAKRIANEVAVILQAQVAMAVEQPQPLKTPEIPRNPVTDFLKRWDLD
ncbi:hypothetical protein IW967_02865 [Alicyclobacillus mali]|uniref:Uncharacterized protein n=2 Tax=Alicyclobacillus mali (ex Roth et al. 2021) TaxID=1123961 RepID=A0ABS0F0J4_9BACL|nr:hypothetical protein [Alicyclobacillus mali (ex Roth et al. 2021)]